MAEDGKTYQGYPTKVSEVILRKSLIELVFLRDSVVNRV